MRLKVLVVEDKLSLNRSIVSMLEKEDFTAFGVFDMEEAKKVFMKQKPNIVLLDIMLPHGLGYELINFFRKQNDCWVVMLTALDDEQSKRISYENGADDYITKPFDLYEFLYKLNAIRRRVLSNLKEYKIGDITFHIDTNKLMCNNGKEIIIQPSQMKFLKLMYDKYMENSYVDKSEALEETSEEVNEAPRLQTMVARLRKNISYVGSRQVDIETIYGKGYQIIVEQKSNEEKAVKE